LLQSTYGKASFFAVFGVIFAAYAWWNQRACSGPDCMKRFLDGAAADAFQAGDVVRVTKFVVEHPGVEHKLMIGPMHHAPIWRRADYEVRLHARLTQGDGEPLRAEELVFEPRFRSTCWCAACWGARRRLPARTPCRCGCKRQISRPYT